MFELIVRLLFSLAVVIGLLMLLARVGARRFRGSGGSLVNVVHRQPLTRSASVAVVSVGGRILLVGATEQQITVLAELDPDDLPEATGETAPATPHSSRAPLGGSVLSPQTWKQAYAAATRRVELAPAPAEEPQ